MSQENKVNIGIGDIVKVTASDCGHGFAIGELAKVVRIEGPIADIFLCESNSGAEYWLNIYNCEIKERCKDRQLRDAAPELLDFVVEIMETTTDKIRYEKAKILIKKATE